jgi:TonB family protein
MISLINYMVEANVALIMFYLIYRLLLVHETDVIIIRYLLLSVVTASLVFPLIHIDLAESLIAQSLDLPSYQLTEITVTPGAESVHTSSLGTYIFYGYLAGVLFFGIRFLLQLLKLSKLINRAQITNFQSYKIVESERAAATFSFFHYIFIGNAKSLTPYEKELIIYHETIHAKRLHSIDILLMELCGILFWFNPIIKLYKKIFVQLHEFEADARAAEAFNADKYCNLLARVALTSADIPIANYFNQSLTIKRIEMMRTVKANIKSWKLGLITLALPALTLVLACHDQVVAQQTQQQKNPSNEVYAVVDNMPEFKNGLNGLGEFLGSTLKYPEEAKKQHLEGKVFVEFVVEKDGTLSNVNVLKGVNKMMDEEAVRAVKLMPNWTPGKLNDQAVRTKMVLPINFKL